MELALPADKKRKRKYVVVADSLKQEEEEAAQLQSLLFGNLEESFGDYLGHELHEAEAEAEVGPSNQDEELGIANLGEENVGFGKKPAWVDEEEAQTSVSISHVHRLRKLRTVEGEKVIPGSEYVERLRAQHRKLNPGTSWAELPCHRKERRRRQVGDTSDDSESEVDDVHQVGDRSRTGLVTLKENVDLVVNSKSRLPPGLINVSRLRDANSEEPSSAVVQSVQFHRNAQILMTAGFDKKLRFFQIDGTRNPKVQSIFLEGFPIHKAAFLADGSKVISAGRRKYFYVYDMEGGKVDKVNQLIGREEKSLESFEVSPDSKVIAFQGNEGYILLTSLASKQWIGNLKLNGSVRALSFAEDGRELLSVGEDGEVYTWDMRTRRCIHKGRDEGGVKTTTLGVSADSSLFATGSGGGVVNVYEKNSFLGGATRPRKTLMNLVTSIDNVKFNHDSQILAITSRMKKDALRLVHLPSYTVFSNWPTSGTPLQYVHSLDFSPRGGYIAVGNAGGRVLLYRLHYYDHA